eukprot:TRINITY_DN2939_c0_g1_i1.p1 TRINITY_DN2939_c0_g1~~TRINITY_DN2939_c0_g1_i1.p1  ORF type:complete len:273 (-),score=31.88 TRINITY_DN2939_c0_g1_i1:166-984(-)
MGEARWGKMAVARMVERSGGFGAFMNHGTVLLMGPTASGKTMLIPYGVAEERRARGLSGTVYVFLSTVEAVNNAENFYEKIQLRRFFAADFLYRHRHQREGRMDIVYMTTESYRARRMEIEMPGALIFDEIHEHQLPMEVCFMRIRERMEMGQLEGLHVLVMSATVQMEQSVAFLSVMVKGTLQIPTVVRLRDDRRRHQVEIVYLDQWPHYGIPEWQMTGQRPHENIPPLLRVLWNVIRVCEQHKRPWRGVFLADGATVRNGGATSASNTME